MLLQDFPCRVVHVSGKKTNVVADILSRYPLPSVPLDLNELDDFAHVLIVESTHLGWESELNYIYIYLKTLRFEGIPEEKQRQT